MLWHTIYTLIIFFRLLVGMPEMLKPTSLIMGAGLGLDVACLTDGRFSGGCVTSSYRLLYKLPVISDLSLFFSISLV